MKFYKLIKSAYYIGYHGSQNPKLVLTNKPLYLTSNYDEAKDWADGYGFNYDLMDSDIPTVYKIQMTFNNPKQITTEEEYEEFMDITSIPNIIQQLTKDGYDGVIYNEIGYYLVFNAQKQCKILGVE